MTQEQPRASEGQPPSGSTNAAISVEEAVHKDMWSLAERFQKLLAALSTGGLMRQMRIKPSQGVVIGEARVFSGPSTLAKQVDIAHSSMIVRVYPEEIKQAFPSGTLWYRVSKPSAPPRYIAAGLVIRDNLHQSLQLYFQLATQVWEAVAADRLEEMAHSEAYKKGMAALHQQLEQFEELCHNAKQIAPAKGNRKEQRRIRLYQRALKVWQDDCLGNDPGIMLSNPTRCGHILYRAQGYLGLASCNGFDYVLIKSLQILNILVSLLSFWAVVLLVEHLSTNTGAPISTRIIALLVFLFAPVYLLWLSSIGISLPVMMGYALTKQWATGAVQIARKTPSQFLSCLQPFFQTCADIPRNLWNLSHHLLRYWLRIWGILLLISLLSISVYIITNSSLLKLQGIALITVEALTISLFYISTCFFIILPFTLTMQAQMWAELRAHPQRPPEARRSTVGPATKLLSFHMICLLAIVIPILSLVPFFSSSTVHIISGPLPVDLQQLVGYLIVVMLPYLLWLELPYRWGLRRWKTYRLDELSKIRKGVDKRVSRMLLAAVVEKELPLEDYVLWQLYRSQEEDIKKTLPGPFSLVQRGWAFVITIASSYLIGTAINLLPHIHPKFPWT